jgi:hypothetical protein
MKPSIVIEMGRAVSQLALENFLDVDDGVAGASWYIYKI